MTRNAPIHIENYRWCSKAFQKQFHVYWYRFCVQMYFSPKRLIKVFIRTMNSAILFKPVDLRLKKKPEAADIYIFQFSDACNKLYHAVSQHHICIQCVLTTVMSDAEKHHTLLMLTSRLSHNPPPSSHSMANIRSAIDRTKIGCTCAYM